MPLSSPLDINNCKVWLDASDLSTLSGLSAGEVGSGNFRPTNSNDLVGFIGDKSNNNNNFSNYFGKPESRPVLINNAQNSKSVLRFNGLNYLTGLFTLPISAQTTFAVVSRRLAPNLGVGRVYTQSSGGADTAPDNHYIPIVIDGNGSFSSYISGAYRSSIAPPQLSAFDVYTSALSTNAVSGFVFNYLGGLSSITSVANPIRRTSSLYTVLCSRIGAGVSSLTADSLPTTYTNLTGDIGEIIVYDRFLTREERTSVELYLASKWNLPLTFYATKSGNWSDESIWSVSGTPLPRSDVYSNGYLIDIDRDVNVRGILGIHTSPQNTASTAGTFRVSGPFNITAATSGFVAGTNVGILATLSGTDKCTLSGNILGGSTLGSHGFFLSGINGACTIYGNVSGGSNAIAYGVLLQGNTGMVESKLNISIYGSVFGRTGTGVVNGSTDYIGITGNLIQGGTGAGSFGVANSANGGVYIASDVIGGTNATAYGVNNPLAGFVTLVGNISGSVAATGCLNSSTGVVIVKGNIVAHPNSHGLVSTSSRCELSCRFFNASGGRQAVYATRFTVPERLPDMKTVFDRRYAVTNLLSSSETFTSPNWFQPFAIVNIVPNTWYTPLVSPYSSNVASTLQANAASSGIFSIRRHFVPSATAGTPYTFSVYAAQHTDAGVTGYLELIALTPSGINGAIFDLATGNTITVSPCAVPSKGNAFDPDTDFRRYGLTFFTPGATTCFIEIRVTTSTSLSQQITSATGNEKFYIWGAQLQQSPTLNGYVATNNSSTTTSVQTYDPGIFVNEGPTTYSFIDANNYLISNLPNQDNVKYGTTYGGFNSLGLTSTLSGNMFVPPRSSVKYNVSIDNSVGDAIFSTEDAIQIWNLNLNQITRDNSIGNRIKNIATTFDVGSALNNMNI